MFDFVHRFCRRECECECMSASKRLLTVLDMFADYKGSGMRVSELKDVKYQVPRPYLALGPGWILVSLRPA